MSEAFENSITFEREIQVTLGKSVKGDVKFVVWKKDNPFGKAGTISKEFIEDQPEAIRQLVEAIIQEIIGSTPAESAKEQRKG